MGVELIKDSKGKPHMVFDKDKSKEDEIMGEKVDDYEILQVLGEGSFGFVAKVKSRINHKIYAIKQINLTKLKSDKERQLCENEITILKNLNHPSITKYYKSIKENNFLYTVMEFMNNGDLSGLIKAHKILNKPINEEKLWNIFIQAMKSLVFIHSKNLIHRDIKPENLFISNDGTVKLGDFGVSASIVDSNKFENIKKELISNWVCSGTCVGTPPFMSPEMLKKNTYDLNTDVYSMGCTFFESMFWIYPRTPIMDIAALFSNQDIMKLVDLPIKHNNNYYSKELVDIIYKMIEIDKNKRPNSEQILKMLIYEFNKKYAKNSNISSVLSCLYSYQEFTELFLNNQQYINDNSNTKPISFTYLFGINAINDQVNEDWNNSLCSIRGILSKENILYEGNKEIDPKYTLSFLLGKLHNELNFGKNNYIPSFKLLFSNESKTQELSQIDFSNKNNALNYFITQFKQNNNSIISNNFYGIMKIKTVCSKCQLVTYTYDTFDHLSFNLDIVKKYIKQQNQVDITNLFNIQNNIMLNLGTDKYIICRRCKVNTPHLQRRQFNSFPRFLIICLDRGSECQNKMNVLYGLDLNLGGQCENMNCANNFRLIGMIKRLDKGDKEHYISLYFDYRNNIWVCRDGSNLYSVNNNPFNHTQGIVVMLFYIENKINNNNNNYVRMNSVIPNFNMNNQQLYGNSNNNINSNRRVSNNNVNYNNNNNMMAFSNDNLNNGNSKIYNNNNNNNIMVNNGGNMILNNGYNNRNGTQNVPSNLNAFY